MLSSKARTSTLCLHSLFNHHRSFAQNVEHIPTTLKEVFGSYDKKHIPSEFWENTANVRRYLQFVGKQLGYTKMEDWYLAKISDFLPYNGVGLRTKYSGSIYKIVSSVFKDHDWLPWRFMPLPSNTWENETNRLKFLAYLGQKLGYKDMEDYYKITENDFNVHGGGVLLERYYESSPMMAVMRIFNEFPWEPWKFAHAKSGYFDVFEHQMRYMKYLGEQLNFKTMNDWYNITDASITAHHGNHLYSKFGESPSGMVMGIFKDHEWHPWKFRVIPRNYWTKPEHQAKFVKYLGARLGYKTLEDWYEVAQADFSKEGSGLLAQFSGSPILILASVLPTHKWERWRFRNYGLSEMAPEDIQHLLMHLGQKLGYTKMEDWYTTKNADLEKAFGKSFSWAYFKHGNLPTLITTCLTHNLYDDKNTPHKWESWRFPARSQPPLDSQKTKEQELGDYISALSTHLDIKSLEDWYRVSKVQLAAFGGMGFLKSHGGLWTALANLYPNHPWDNTKFPDFLRKKSQFLLKSVLTSIFPSKEIIENYRHSNLTFKDSTYTMELDCYLPHLSLGFEYQGSQHYNKATQFLTSRMPSDGEKIQACKLCGISLVLVPHYWDGRQQSLVGYIKQYSGLDIVIEDKLKSEFYTDNNAELQKKPKEKKEKGEKSKKGYVEPMLSTIWEPSNDPTGWFLQEKFDGTRVIWDGRVFYQRNGRLVTPPQWFLEHLPKNEVLDGELWMGRKVIINSSMLTDPTDPKWKQTRFMIFDTPNDQPFSARITTLSALNPALPKHAKVIPTVRCESQDHLNRFYLEVTQKSGEGVMLRQPDSKYENGIRSEGLRKLKAWEDSDVEFLSVSKTASALICLQNDGKTEVSVKCTSAVYCNPPAPGTLLTVRHTGRWGSGRLKNPIFHQTREDLKPFKNL
eukprot:Phypoly_transcript_02449.p1 GENE.Phypoly_transcript_02449~~Phypoly_transcript_02449.p1  ORF type:complete len:911 (+),score=126.14 Phypoly_transcript_02449:48-2780(+)